FVSRSATAPAATPSDDAAGVTFFEQRVRPLLVEHCYECHSADSKIVQGGLLLDSKQGWLQGGDSGTAIIPGDPDKSLLIRAVRFSEDEDVQMPPKGKLGDDAIATLDRWVKLGAPDPRNAPTKLPAARVIDIEQGRTHWAFQPLKVVDPPRVKNDVECRSQIDRFIAAAYEEHALHGNPSADAQTLLRRASFDVLGLPPAPERVDALQNDASSDEGYEALVDDLLASPQFGERWARHWLDLARFAESHGYEQDYDRPHAYPYRDFVIRAFNEDLPYDTFIRWQLAGDEYEPDNALALAATGFLGAGVHATQITANQAEKERYDELDDMVRTIGTSMLGLTVGCARCHDHKYDPIPVTDYYRMASVFTSTVRSDQWANPDAERYRQEVAAFDERHRPLVEARQKRERKLAKRFDQWLAKDALEATPPPWTLLEPTSAAGDGTFELLDDASVRFIDSNKIGNETRVVTAVADAKDMRFLRLEALGDEHAPNLGPGLADDGTFELQRLKVQATSADGKQTKEIKIAPLPASNTRKGEDSKEAAPDWTLAPTEAGGTQVLLFKAHEAFGFGPGTKLRFTLVYKNHEKIIGRVRLSLSSEQDPPLDVRPADALVQSAIRAMRLFEANPDRPLGDDTRTALAKWQQLGDAQWCKLEAAVQADLAKRPKPPLQRTLVCTEGVQAIRLHTQGPDCYDKTFLLKRGDTNQKLDESQPGYLRVLMNVPEEDRHWQQAPPNGSHTSYRRRALAEWLTDTHYGAGNLLARVIVNRLWYYHMGRGLVSTPSDFGLNGDRPSHPELL
ncbi:MAG TPA: DUF1549 domain-containing protein, partial [Pirellulales bacterium]|nr:DUF1549 domain-containing protein [Pirellulales bacterium]